MPIKDHGVITRLAGSGEGVDSPASMHQRTRSGNLCRACKNAPVFPWLGRTSNCSGLWAGGPQHSPVGWLCAECHVMICFLPPTPARAASQHPAGCSASPAPISGWLHGSWDAAASGPASGHKRVTLARAHDHAKSQKTQCRKNGSQAPGFPWLPPHCLGLLLMKTSDFQVTRFSIIHTNHKTEQKQPQTLK